MNKKTLGSYDPVLVAEFKGYPIELHSRVHSWLQSYLKLVSRSPNVLHQEQPK